MGDDAPTMPMESPHSAVGVVVIGRNESARLERSLESALATCTNVIYVDSDSEDGSRNLACDLQIPVVDLDPSMALSAARARNAGARELLGQIPPPEFIQFMDGDTVLDPDWLEIGRGYLSRNPNVAVVVGKLREKAPHRSIFNLLCDLEWRGPPGEVKSCGGNLIIRSEALQQVGMFNSTMVAGEEPELCIRLRRLTWKIVRLDQIMSVHDADMTSITQWWTRSSRAGRAFIELACLHREYGVRQALSTVIWGLLIPAGIVCLAFKYGSVGWLIGGGAYFIQVVRIFDSRLRLGDSKSEALLYSIFCLAQKIPQLHGMIIHLARSLRTPKSKLTLH